MDDLLAWSERWGTDACADIMVMLPDDFPRQPPEVRMLRPLLRVRMGCREWGGLSGAPLWLLRTRAQVFGRAHGPRTVWRHLGGARARLCLGSAAAAGA